MTHRALVVEDNEDIAERVTEILDSLGHEYVWVRSQEEARQPIAEGGIHYVLLDLSIPVKTQRGLDTIEYGANLAKEMHQSPAMQGVPIRAGERLRVPEFAKRLHCSYSTAKRAVDALKANGVIVFVGATKTGYYDLVEDKALAAVSE